MANTPTPTPIDLRDRVDVAPAAVQTYGRAQRPPRVLTDTAMFSRGIAWPLTLADRRRGGAT